MGVAKITISMEKNLLKKVDQMVSLNLFGNRSQAIQQAVEEKIERLDHSRLARECGNLDIKEEQDLAEEGISLELEEWPEY